MPVALKDGDDAGNLADELGCCEIAGLEAQDLLTTIAGQPLGRAVHEEVTPLLEIKDQDGIGPALDQLTVKIICSRLLQLS
jgi:hypothetical protein